MRVANYVLFPQLLKVPKKPFPSHIKVANFVTEHLSRILTPLDPFSPLVLDIRELIHSQTVNLVCIETSPLEVNFHSAK